jgi:CRP/FNR family transcriptional regulator/CRP/FNR family cyclic AMP-dependent transcriptional regulator
MPADELLTFLRTVHMFAGMDDVELASLKPDLKRRSYDAGETLFFQGDAGKAVYIVEAGTVRIYVHAEDGQEVSVVLYGRGDLFGEMSLLDQMPRSATAEAMEDTVLWVMSGADFDRHLRTSHQLALNVMLTLSTRLRETNEQIKSLASLDVTRRIVKKLLSLALRQGRKTDRGLLIESRLTQGALASLISASRESTNRALKALQRKGLIDMQDGHIVLLEVDELSSLVGTDETWW